MLALDDSEASRERRQAYIDPVRKMLTPNAEVFFAGKVDLARLSFFERLLTKAVNAPEADLRDWKAIRSWAEGLYPTLG